MKMSAKTAAPMAEPYDREIHSSRSPDAVISVTRTEHFPLVFGEGHQTPGQIIDDMLRNGEVTKVTLDLDKDNF